MTARDANLLGALAVAAADALHRSSETAARHGAGAPAALVALANDPGQSIERLRHRLALSHSGAVRLVDRLAAEGLVERRPALDARSRTLLLTTRGRATAEAIREERERVLRGALDALEPDEQAVLVALLEKLLAGLTPDRAAADRICRLCDERACEANGERCPVDVAATPDRRGADGPAR